MTDNNPSQFADRIGGILVDVAFVGGSVSITAGAWQIYHPAAFIVGGILLLSGASLAARRGA